MNKDNRILPQEDQNHEAEDSNTSLHTHVYRTGSSIHFFKGVSTSRHAEVEVDKAESTLIWVFVLLGLIVGVALVISHHLFAGVFACIFISMAGILGVGLKAILKKQNSEDTKTALMVLSLFIFVFLFIGIIFFVVFRGIT